MGGSEEQGIKRGCVVDRRRRRRRNGAGQYVLEHELYPVTTHAAGRLVTDICGSTMDARDLGGRQWPSTNGCIEITGSWKTRGLRKACKEVGVSPVNEMAVTAETTDGGVAVHGRVGRKSSGPRDRQDRQHDEIQTPDPRTPRTLRALRTRAHSRFGRLTSKPDDSSSTHSGASAKRTNGKADNAWLDATTDSVDDYTAVDGGGVTDRKHVASESLDGCDQ
ncbi:hypothetical protein PF010_g31908 [Phytophthora fragariae]|uniref:Uncharacterized protein n=1 Tax=Phytophthora fragariae TaxID=53985 RepID=A0A6G0JGY3_9STRA|nr:hypothetical protein PF010_g31908 [Phytophthora fragariae]